MSKKKKQYQEITDQAAFLALLPRQLIEDIRKDEARMRKEGEVLESYKLDILDFSKTTTKK